MVTNTLGILLEMQRAGQVEAGLVGENVLICEQDTFPRFGIIL